MRYIVVEGSQSAHCCFQATVCDTHDPVIFDGVHQTNKRGELQYYSFCECLDERAAKIICDALNNSKK